MKTFVLLLVGLFLTTNSYAVPDVRSKVVELHMVFKDKPAEKTRFRQEQFANRGVCSGFFVDATGDILTARHCTENLQELTIVTSDGREYIGTLTNQAQQQDLALVHIDALNTPSFKVAMNVAVGETVYAYGSPLGLTGTLTTGTVAKIAGDLTYMNLTVLPGNSGCPVFDGEGNVVGVMTGGFVVMSGMTDLTIAQGIYSMVYFLLRGY